MQIGIIGLGRMGANMARRLARGGVQVVAYDRQDTARAALADEAGVATVNGLAALCARLGEGERVILMMLPAGEAIDATLDELGMLVSSGDTLVDGGNSFYRDSMRRALALSQSGLRYVDAGVSGGIHGLAHGYCLMLGGTPSAVEQFTPFAEILAPGRDRLAALRAERRRALRQDGPQRHRVRDDAGLRRGLRPAAGEK